jgi:hypothetical protein
MLSSDQCLSPSQEWRLDERLEKCVAGWNVEQIHGKKDPRWVEQSLYQANATWGPRGEPMLIWSASPTPPAPTRISSRISRALIQTYAGEASTRVALLTPLARSSKPMTAALGLVSAVYLAGWLTLASASWLHSP